MFGGIVVSQRARLLPFASATVRSTLSLFSRPSRRIDLIFAGGAFTTSDGAAVNRVARWDGSLWQPLGAGADGMITRLCHHDGGLVALVNPLAGMRFGRRPELADLLRSAQATYDALAALCGEPLFHALPMLRLLQLFCCSGRCGIFPPDQLRQQQGDQADNNGENRQNIKSWVLDHKDCSLPAGYLPAILPAARGSRTTI